MRQFWIALVCLSTLAMAQNMVVVAPLSTDEDRAACPPAEITTSQFSPASAFPGGEVPTPATMLLLVVGLSGLTAVGGRNRDLKNHPLAD
jgi:hypothetical protein